MDVTGISVAEARRIENNSIVGARINEAGQLILKKGDNVTEFNAGQVVPNSWPVGSIFIHTSPTNPSQLLLLPNSTWERYGKGKALVSVEEGSSYFPGSGATFGEAAVTLAKTHMPSHAHLQNPHSHTSQPHDHEVVNGNDAGSALTGGGFAVVENQNATSGVFAVTQPIGGIDIVPAGVGINDSTATMQAEGGSQPHNNIQPSIAVYVWRRTG